MSVKEIAIFLVVGMIFYYLGTQGALSKILPGG